MTNAFVCLFEALRPGQQLFIHFGILGLTSTKQWDEVSCSRTHTAPRVSIMTNVNKKVQIGLLPALSDQ